MKGSSGWTDLQDDVFNGQTEKDVAPRKVHSELPIILPPALKKGAKLAITAPASPTTYWEMRYSLKELKRIGLEIEVGDTIKKRQSKYRYLSASDEERASEFMDFINRDDIDGIMCGRGGYGVMRILPMLDFDAIARNPKPVIGYSDITALLIAIYNKTRIVTFHGPVAISTFNDYTMNHFRKILLNSEKFEPVKSSYSTMETFVEGKASGRITGGNLSMLVGTLGTPYEIDTKDSLLFIEDVSEHAYKIDRMLTQLLLAGKIQDANGISIGYFKGLNSRRPFYPGGSFTIKEVLDQLIKPIGKPTILGMPIGHVKSKLTMPIGIQAVMDAVERTFTILETSVEYLS